MGPNSLLVLVAQESFMIPREDHGRLPPITQTLGICRWPSRVNIHTRSHGEWNPGYPLLCYSSIPVFPASLLVMQDILVMGSDCQWLVTYPGR